MAVNKLPHVAASPLDSPDGSPVGKTLSDKIVNAFDAINMASGGIALVLEPRAAWEDFPDYAKKWAEKLGAKKASKPIITFDECLLEVEIDGGSFWITYDDFQSSIQLEPKDKKYNEIVLSVQKRLQQVT